MSCFYVGNKHINWIISYANSLNINKHPEHLIGLVLAYNNYKSIMARYDYEGEISYSFDPIEINKGNEFVHLQAIVACDCLEYQSNEHSDWTNSIAKEFLDYVRSTAMLINKKKDNSINRQKVEWVID